MIILYADDDTDDQEFLIEGFRSVDPTISCTTARDGSDLLGKLSAMTRLPDCILLDVNMPVMNGKSCLMVLKEDVRYKDIPVVIYTTSRDAAEINELYTLGAYSYFQKPESVAKLRILVSSFLTLVAHGL
jgi:CheY-like chemotaxis protein